MVWHLLWTQRNITWVTDCGRCITCLFSLHGSGQMQTRAEAQYEWSGTWLAVGYWGILSFSQRLIHYSAHFPRVEIQHIFLFNHVCQLSDFIRAMFHIHLLRFAQRRAMNETILALLKQQLVHVFCEPNFWAITQISGWGLGFCSSGLIFSQASLLFLYQLSITPGNF